MIKNFTEKVDEAEVKFLVKMRSEIATILSIPDEYEQLIAFSGEIRGAILEHRQSKINRAIELRQYLEVLIESATKKGIAIEEFKFSEVEKKILRLAGVNV
jgi:hypothetical protein